MSDQESRFLKVCKVFFVEKFGKGDGGKMSMGEYRQMCDLFTGKMGLPRASESIFETLFGMFDLDQDGMLDYGEFIEACRVLLFDACSDEMWKSTFELAGVEI